MFSFFKKKPQPAPVAAPPPPEPTTPAPALPVSQPAAVRVVVPTPAPTPLPTQVPTQIEAPAPTAPLAPIVDAAPAPSGAATSPPSNWFGRLQQGLRKSGAGIATVFVGTRIEDALYEELESALLMADAGVAATEWLMENLKRSVRAHKLADPAAVRSQLAVVLADLLRPLEAELNVGAATPTVMMVVGVNGAGKTTSIGKLTRHLAEADYKVLLAAADTFRAAAREQLAAWADRTQVAVISQEGGDPAAVSFDAVSAGRARGVDVVIADTAGRLPTQVHLMAELKKIQRTIGKAMSGAPHEVLLVVDGNTGQNALAQLKAFDAALTVTGLIVTKLDGTAKGGVLAAIARWGAAQGRVVPVYFIGLGEKLEDLQRFDADDFARALVG